MGNTRIYISIHLLLKLHLTILIVFCVVIFSCGQVMTDSILSSPKACMYNHLYYLQPETYQPARAAKSFILAGDSLSAVNNAIMLKQIFDARGLYVYINSLPDHPAYTDSLTGNSIFTPFPYELPEVYIVKSGKSWVYSAETNEKIPALLKRTFPLGTDRLVKHLSNKSGKRILGLALWQYIAILILMIGAFVLYKLISFILHFSYKKITKTRFSNLLKFDEQHRFSNPLSTLLMLYFIKIFLPIVQLKVKWVEIIMVGIDLLRMAILGVILLRLVDVVTHFSLSMAKKTESKLDEQLIPMVRKLLKIIIVTITIMYMLNRLHINITALIAGVSIGGLALALAAQDTVKNFIGSLMIFLDAPFQIGDYIIVNNMEGTVVEVGFRSTKIQTIDSSIISIPNGNLSSSTLTNKGVRTFRLFNTILGIEYGTPPEKIKQFIKGLKEIIISHPNTSNEGYYVHLSTLSPSSIDILFRVRLNTLTYDDELRLKEEITFAILDLANQLSIDFAFPSQTIYVRK